MFEVEFLPIEIKLMPIKYTIIAGLLSFFFFKFYVLIIYFLYVVFNRIKYYLFALRFYIFIFLNFKSVNFIIKLFKNKNKNKKKTFTEYIRIRDVLFKEFLSKDYLSYAFVLRQFF